MHSVEMNVSIPPFSLTLGFVPPIITQPLTTSQMTYPRPVVSTGVNRNSQVGGLEMLE